jgi:hypothetical protein
MVLNGEGEAEAGRSGTGVRPCSRSALPSGVLEGREGHDAATEWSGDAFPLLATKAERSAMAVSPDTDGELSETGTGFRESLSCVVG